MHFTLVFDSPEQTDLSYSICFIPCPVWVRGEKEILNLHSDYPDYRNGDLSVLINKEKLNSRVKSKKLLIVVHESGHGSTGDLELLENEARDSGFLVSLSHFG